MKRFFTLVVVIIVILAVRYDLTKGTIGNIEQTSTEETVTTEVPLPYFEHTVEPGDTLISIIERQTGRSLPVAIEQVIKDFQQFNHGLPPNKIQIGEQYKFPLYERIPES